MRTAAYSTFLDRYAGLIGVDADDLQDAEKTIANGFFNFAIREAWSRSNWIDLCPWAEARLVGNQLRFPNGFDNTTYWTATAVTVTANSVPNPADGRTTADKLLESSATSAHSISQSVTFLPNTNYSFYLWCRYNGRQYVKLTVNDASTSFTSFFDILNGLTGTIGSGVTASITQGDNGFYLCKIDLTSSSSAGAGSVTMNLASDGSTTSYAGDTSKGVYLWGALLVKTTNTGQQDNRLDWEQDGESPIEAVFQVWQQNPTKTALPNRARYEVYRDGIQIYGSQNSTWVAWVPSLQGGDVVPANPVWLYYRKECPSFTGDAFSASATYAVDDQILYTDADSVQNYYKCLVATTAGQDPDDTPASWELLEIPEFLLNYCVWSAYGQWLGVEGQIAKSEAIDVRANRILDDEFDRQERQIGTVLPTKFSSYVTTQNR